MAVDLQPPILVHAEPPGEGVEQHQRLGQGRHEPVRREEALAARRRGRVVVDQRRVRHCGGDVEVGEPQRPARRLLAGRHQRRLHHLHLHLDLSSYLKLRRVCRSVRRLW
ncbi:hypothetical protein ACQ4PT_057809 [Festuca glaucescens]